MEVQDYLIKVYSPDAVILNTSDINNYTLFSPQDFPLPAPGESDQGWRAANNDTQRIVLSAAERVSCRWARAAHSSASDNGLRFG